MANHKGLFFTFEGIDGCGKSTQAKKLYAMLKKSGFSVILLREPGGTVVSEKIRRILLDKKQTINPEAELLLYSAARAQITEQKILPALDKGAIVICDRYYDSTVAYQGYGRGLDLKLIDRLNRTASFGLTPDATFVFDVDYKTSLKRRNKTPDRLENEKQAFFNRVRRGFKELSRKRRVILLDGRKDIDSLFALVCKETLKVIDRKKSSRAR